MLYMDGWAPTLGATGGGLESVKNSTTLTDVGLTVWDTSADGHHVGVRLVTRRSNGTNHYWSWHELYAGSGTHDSWKTSATDSGGIEKVWEEVAVFEGDSKLGSCTTSPQAT